MPLKPEGAAASSDNNNNSNNGSNVDGGGGGGEDNASFIYSPFGPNCSTWVSCLPVFFAEKLN